jgi:hypothetical protein
LKEIFHQIDWGNKMATGLNISRLVRVQVILAAQAAARRSFGIGLAIGSSNVINVVERFRSYDSLESISQDFNSSTPEYLAAVKYYAQRPQPRTFYIGRWAETDTNGLLIGGSLSIAEQNILLWNSITDGSFTFDLDGVSTDVLSIDFTGVTNLNGVASAINTAMGAGAIMTWDGVKFTLTSATTGTTSTIGFLTAAGIGTDISLMLKMTSASASLQVDGIMAESPLAAVIALADISSTWYAMGFALNTTLADNDILSIADYIEALTIKRTYWVTTQDPTVKSSLSTSDIGSTLKAGGYRRTFLQFSDTTFIDSFSAMARIITTNFLANNSVITLMYKQEPTVTPVILTSSEADVLKDKRVNVFAAYDNDTAIIQYGTMSGDVYSDEIVGLDWFEDALQNACYNALYTSNTKIPQTDSGQNILVNVCSAVCDEAVNNGLVAAGTWNGDGFGQLIPGDFLPAGFYIYSPPMASQSQVLREQRISQTIQIAIKLAGAIHEVDVIVNVNR